MANKRRKKAAPNWNAGFAAGIRAAALIVSAYLPEISAAVVRDVRLQAKQLEVRK